MKKLCALVCLLFLLQAVAEDEPSLASLLAQTNERLWAGFNSGRLDDVLAAYTENARLLPEDSPALTGKKEIREFYSAFIGTGLKMKYAKPDDLKVLGDTAIEVGKYCMEVDEVNRSEELCGKYVTIWKKENGTWLIDVDISNSDTPLFGH